MQPLRLVFRIMIIALIALVVIVSSYLLYVILSYNRIPDNTQLQVTEHFPSKLNSQRGTDSDIPILSTDVQYSALTYNIGFGAYNHDFSFFMDEGFLSDGTKTKGERSRAESVEIVNIDTNLAIDLIAEQNPDFVLLQEVDVKAHRSYKVNQLKKIVDSYSENLLNPNNISKSVMFCYTYAQNLHTPYLFYPLTQPIGNMKDAGLLTISKYNINEATRKSFPIDESFPTKFFDLDRCFSINRLPVSEGNNKRVSKELVLINTHMSAYDEGGTIRRAQMEVLSNIIEDEYRKGNYVIVGGDFNHAIGGSEKNFMNAMNTPPWVQPFDEESLPENFRLVVAENNDEVATVRDSSIPYRKGFNYEAALDGFIVSDNVKASALNIDSDYVASDHNPVKLAFILE